MLLKVVGVLDVIYLLGWNLDFVEMEDVEIDTPIHSVPEQPT